MLGVPACEARLDVNVERRLVPPIAHGLAEAKPGVRRRHFGRTGPISQPLSRMREKKFGAMKFIIN